MKKALFLLLAIMLCMSLCACGGMSGEKAAELYPDIIGEWGTDPFGEEFVLTLSKDGSCTVLDTVGTWTLDSKQSNEEYVVLTVKTENVSYYVKLDRVQPDRRYMYDSVNLVIMDAKQEIPVYEGFVFTQGDHFVSPELALHTVPELIGEWGSHYWAEESVLTVREDGTCTVLRQPGKWCLWRDFSQWPKIVILIKLENGLQYECEFYVWEDRNFTLSGFSFYNRAENQVVYVDPLAGTSEVKAINRSKVEHASEKAFWVLGSWVSEDDHSGLVTFRKDGTCTFRGAEGLWTLDYNHYRDSPEEPDELNLIIKIENLEYYAHVYGKGNNRAAIYVFGNGMEIMTDTNAVKISG